VNWCFHSTLNSTLSLASPTSTHYGVRPLTYPMRVIWEWMLDARAPDPNDLRSWWADTMWGAVSHAVKRLMHPATPISPTNPLTIFKVVRSPAFKADNYVGCYTCQTEKSICDRDGKVLEGAEVYQFVSGDVLNVYICGDSLPEHYLT
jgi:hypothetical protein